MPSVPDCPLRIGIPTSSLEEREREMGLERGWAHPQIEFMRGTSEAPSKRRVTEASGIQCASGVWPER